MNKRELRWATGLIQGKKQVALKGAASIPLAFEEPGAAQVFEDEFFGRHPHLRVLKGKTFKSTVAGKARGTESASFESGKIILKPDFFAAWAKHGLALADEVYAHELGHSVEGYHGLAWLVTSLEGEGVDPWQHTDRFPFGEGNVSEAFATTFAVMAVGSQEDRQRLKKQWAAWAAVVAAGAKSVGLSVKS